MADLSSKSKKKRKNFNTRLEIKPNTPKKKRGNAQNEIEEEKKCPKRQEFDHNTTMEEVATPWRNLQLIISLQSKEIDLEKKVELACNYVSSRLKEELNENELENCQTVNLARLVVFLSDWVQSLLISTDKKLMIDAGVVVEACLDYRCWVVFKFCLEQSLRFQVSLSLSRNLLRAFSFILRNALSILPENALDCKDLYFDAEGFGLYSVVLDCVSLVFSSHGGLLNQNLELWILTSCSVLELVLKIFDENPKGGNSSHFPVRFCCLLLEPFGKFLKVHPARKNGFRDFVDELLGPLLHLMGVLHLHADGSDTSWMGNLLPIAKEVLAQGLFHSVHIDGFLSLHSTEKYSVSNSEKVKDSKIVNKSYHRHFFDKLERIMASKKEAELVGLGELFQLLVDGVKKPKVVSLLPKERKVAEKHDGSVHLSGYDSIILHQRSNAPPENCDISSHLTKEKRKSLLDFFVQIMEPLYLEMETYLQSNLAIGPQLLDVHCTLKSINHLLSSFSCEKLYVKTEDVSEGGFLNFLKKIYNSIFSFSTNVLHLPINDADKKMQETVTSLAKELLVALRHLLDIEYDVIENELTSLWVMLFSYLAFCHCFGDTTNQCLLISQIVGFGCQLVKLYSELRQVEISIFSLCKAMRLLIVLENNGSDEQSYSCSGSCATSLPYEAFAAAVKMMLCAQEFRLSVQNGIKSIPEGQASECIRQLSKDLSESIEYLKISCSVSDLTVHQESNTRSGSMCYFDLQSELLGTGFSEIYVLVLESMTVTAGNSSLLGRSLKDLMAVICPSMTILVGLQPDSMIDFLSFITGETSNRGLEGSKHNMPNFGASTHWLFVFFFRLYMSCRSLYRQAITLMPPSTSRKMSEVMWDSFTAYSGRDLMERTNWTSDGYFSWISQPSASLLVIIKSVTDNSLQGSNVDNSPLIYVFHAMVLQRLVDLNRQIKALEYVRKSIDGVIHGNLLDGDGLSQYNKRNKKLGRQFSGLKGEAEDLVVYMLSYLSELVDDSVADLNFGNATCPSNNLPVLIGSDEWDFGVCSVTKKSLPTAIWWLICQNIDIWSIHASKKKLKMFLSHVIRTSHPFTTRDYTAGKNNLPGEPNYLNTITVNVISSELLTNSILHEHNFVSRHFASRFCRLLKNSVLSLFSDISTLDIDLSSLPDWQEVLNAVPGSKLVSYDELSEERKVSHLSVSVNSSMESTSIKYEACQGLLSLLCWLPKGYMNVKSFSLYMTYLLNLESYIVGSLSESTGAISSFNQYEHLRLLISCRRALKYVVMAYSKEKTLTTHSSVIPVVSEDLFSLLWLFKSVFMVIGLQETFSKDHAEEIRQIIFALMDHTSCVFLALSKHDCTRAIHSMTGRKAHEEQQTNSKVAQELSTSNDQAWESILFMAESMKEQTLGLLASLKDAANYDKAGNHVNFVHLNKLSSMVSWISGFLWGLASSLSSPNAINGDKVEFLRLNFGFYSQIGPCIDVFANFIYFISDMLLIEDDHQFESSIDNQNVEPSDESGQLGSRKFSKYQSPHTDTPAGAQNSKSTAMKFCSTASTVDDSVCSAGARRFGLKMKEVTISSALSKLDNECKILNNCFLQSLLNGDNPEAANLVRQLLIASSAFLRLNLQTNCISSLARLVPTFIGISQDMLLKFANASEVPEQFSIVWLDGALKYLQELGSHFPSITDSVLTQNVYTRLIELHLNALGKCIALQGKEATLASHSTESLSSKLDSGEGSSKSSLSHMPLFLDELKARLRMSFKVWISKSTELLMLSGMEVIKRALVGVVKECAMINEISTGSTDGGKVSLTVAAGIDCLDLFLECISGGQQSIVIREHVQKFIPALFNIILHLKSPLIFYGQPAGSDYNDPDPGAVILMCVEVVTRVIGKRAFQLASCHIAQSLHVPATLFQDFYQLRFSKGQLLSKVVLSNQECNTVAAQHFLDTSFSVELFAACCRLLSTTVRHQKRETEKCIALLQESASVLLRCLETVDNDSSFRNGCFSWGVQDQVKCACALRRIYEELRQNKDDFGQHCFKFLSDYIWVYSGKSPLKTGFRREIDEALKPGVYALMDACSVDDLQYLHSVFGEGPCRNTLKTLQDDYKLNFQYEGKV